MCVCVYVCIYVCMYYVYLCRNVNVTMFHVLNAPSQVIAGIVVLVDPGSIPINAKGEKQRMHLRDSFLNDELDPIYVAYNL